MQPDPRNFSGPRGFPPNPYPPPRRSGARFLFPILAGVGAFCLLCCCAPVGYLILGTKWVFDPAEIRDALAGITDIELGPALNPSVRVIQVTGVESVEFRSTSGLSYVKLTTGARFPLQHSGTLRDARNRGEIAAGGRPEAPAQQQTIDRTVRGQKAQFIYRRYAKTETVSGYFQGKKYPVHLEAELDLSEFPPGVAAAISMTIK
jgi:hypothetical protein